MKAKISISILMIALCLNSVSAQEPKAILKEAVEHLENDQPIISMQLLQQSLLLIQEAYAQNISEQSLPEQIGTLTKHQEVALTRDPSTGVLIFSQTYFPAGEKGEVSDNRNPEIGSRHQTPQLILKLYSDPARKAPILSAHTKTEAGQVQNPAFQPPIDLVQGNLKPTLVKDYQSTIQFSDIANKGTLSIALEHVTVELMVENIDQGTLLQYAQKLNFKSLNKAFK
ncbi:MAG: hypothetical protein AAFX87_01680 [Bacteroidota bacterium]